MKDSLETHRKNASDLSLGASHEKIYEKALELLGRRTPTGTHLEFGSGRGAFVRKLKDTFGHLTVVAIDLMESPHDLNVDQWVSADLNGSLPFDDGLFDSISALEIVEHLENPRHVFRELYRVLLPGGVLVMSTPNNESFRALLSYWKRGHFVAFTDRDYPAHITPLNRKDLMRAAVEAGFEFQEFDYSELGCLPGITRWSWQGLSLGKLKGLRFTDNIFIVLKKIEK